MSRSVHICRLYERNFKIFRKLGLSVRVIKRFDYNIDQIDWADAILTAGGDGTFLMAASKVEGHSKPVIGINTDPIR